jgi:hypothetical protein
MIMIRATGKALHLMVPSATCLVLLSARRVSAGMASSKTLRSFGRESGVSAVVGCGSKSAPCLAVDPGRNRNSLAHAIAGDAKELAAFNTAIAAAGVKGYVTAEQLPLSRLPYRDYLVDVVALMDPKKAEAEGGRLAYSTEAAPAAKAGRQGYGGQLPSAASAEEGEHQDHIPRCRAKRDGVAVPRGGCGAEAPR